MGPGSWRRANLALLGHSGNIQKLAAVGVSHHELRHGLPHVSDLVALVQPGLGHHVGSADLLPYLLLGDGIDLHHYHLPLLDPGLGTPEYVLPGVDLVVILVLHDLCLGGAGSLLGLSRLILQLGLLLVVLHNVGVDDLLLLQAIQEALPHLLDFQLPEVTGLHVEGDGDAV